MKKNLRVEIVLVLLVVTILITLDSAVASEAISHRGAIASGGRGGGGRGGGSHGGGSRGGGRGGGKRNRFIPFYVGGHGRGHHHKSSASPSIMRGHLMAMHGPVHCIFLCTIILFFPVIY